MAIYVDGTPSLTCPACAGNGYTTLEECPRNCRDSQERGGGCFHRNVRCLTCGGRGRVREGAAAKAGTSTAARKAG